MDLNLLNTYVAVIEAGSLTQAARRLRQPVSRVSRSLARLERDLKQHLILRTTRSFQVTDAGRRLFREVQPMIQQMTDLGRSFSQESDELTGTVRITAPEDFGQSVLAPIIAELSLLHPGLEFDLNLTDSYVDLIRTETDIGIRAGDLRDSTLKVKKLGVSSFQFVASRDYIAKFSAPKKPEDLKHHRFIDPLPGTINRRGDWSLSNGTRKERLEYTARWRVTHKGMAAELARAGLGITLLPTPMISRYIASGDLVHVLPDWSLGPGPISLVYPPHRITSRKVREVSRFLEEKLRPLF